MATQIPIPLELTLFSGALDAEFGALISGTGNSAIEPKRHFY